MNKDKVSQETDYYFKLLLKSSAFVFIAVIISKLASYGYKIIIARYFGPEVYGLFTLALVIITIAASITTFGISEGMFRYVSYYRGKKYFGHIKRLVIDARNFFIISGIICTILLALFSGYIAENVFRNGKLGPLILGMGFAIPFMVLSNLYLGVLRGFERVKTYSSLINIYQNIARLGLIALLIIMGFGFASISISYVLTFIGLLIVSNYYARKEISSLKIKNLPPTKEVIPEVFSYSWPLLFSGLLYSVFYWTDSLFLGYFVNAESVGLYNSAITIISLFGIAPDIFMQLFFPIISLKFSEKKAEVIRRLTRQVTKWVYLLNIPIFLVIFLFSEHWITVLFGNEFIAANYSLKILAIGAIFSSIIWIFSNLISISGRTKLVLLDFVIFVLINIILNIMLIPVYGMIGAAIATLTTQILFALVLVIQIKKVYKFNPLKFRIVRLCFITLSLLALGYYVIGLSQKSLIISIAYASSLLLLYFVLVLIFAILDSKDISLFKDFLKKINIVKSNV